MAKLKMSLQKFLDLPPQERAQLVEPPLSPEFKRIRRVFAACIQYLEDSHLTGEEKENEALAGRREYMHSIAATPSNFLGDILTKSRSLTNIVSSADPLSTADDATEIVQVLAKSIDSDLSAIVLGPLSREIMAGSPSYKNSVSGTKTLLR